MADMKEPVCFNFKNSIYKRKGYYRKLVFVLLVFAYLASVCATLVLRLRDFRLNGKDKLHNEGTKRVRRDTGLGLEPLTAEDSENDTECMPRAVEEFPANFFTLKQTQDGAISVHIVLALYMFGALAIVCDDYFVSSLEAICEKLHLQEDVAGATFMAAGSSAPEFFTSVIGVFISKSDVGVGTIVGSAVFNILFIIGVCAIFAGMVVKLTWYPMTRDCLFYLISVAALVIIITDEKVHWYEAMVLVILYLIYILVMYFNRFLEKKCISAVERLKKKYVKAEQIDVTDTSSEERQPLSASSQDRARSYTETSKTSADTETSFAIKSVESTCSSRGEYESPWSFPEPFAMKVYWIFMLPIKVLMFFSIPDCRRPGIWSRLYPLTFFMSIVWIAGASYLMVWMITIAADAIDIPDTVAGLTIIAAGTSVPDCLASIFVARDGFGDMAVSNSIGSNVFDILMCLGLPWLLNSAIIEEEGHLPIRSGGIIYSALILLSTVAFLLVAVNLAKWNLTKPFGFLCLLVYLAVITISCLFELNIFGDFVLPVCDRQ